MAPPPVAKPHLYPRRVIDSDFNVIKQNSDITELTGIDANTQEIKCYDQLSSAICKTLLCPLKQILEDNDRSHDLRYGDKEVELHYAGEDSIMTGKTC